MRYDAVSVPHNLAYTKRGINEIRVGLTKINVIAIVNLKSYQLESHPESDCSNRPLALPVSNHDRF